MRRLDREVLCCIWGLLILRFLLQFVSNHEDVN